MQLGDLGDFFVYLFVYLKTIFKGTHNFRKKAIFKGTVKDKVLILSVTVLTIIILSL